MAEIKTGKVKLQSTFSGSNVLEFLKKDISFLAMIISCMVLFLVGTLINPSFLTIYNLQNLVRHSSILGTIAIGITVVFLIKEIDISVGSLMAFCIILSAAITVKVEAWWGVQAIQGGHYLVHGIIPLFVFALVTATLVGVMNGLIVTKLGINSVITTLGVLYAARGLCYIISGGHSMYLTRLGNFKWFGSGNFLGVPIPAVVFLLVGIIIIVLLHFTIVGRRIYAIGGNERAAKFAGINTAGWKIFAFALSGFLAGVAGLMYSSYLQSADPQQALGYEFSAIAIVVLGGTILEGGKGSVGGTLGAAFVIGLLNNVLDLLGVHQWYQNIVIGLIIVSAVLPTYIRQKPI